MLTHPLKWVGGKSYMAKYIHQYAFPGHTFRLIPFGGALGEFWDWPHEGVAEVVNDLDRRLQNLWQVLQDPDLFQSFQRAVEAIPVGRPFFEEARDYCKRLDPNQTDVKLPSVELAVRFFVMIRQSMMGTGTSFAPLTRKRTRRGMSEQASAWLGAVEGLPAVHERLKRVVVESLPAIELMRRHDKPETFALLDPPYFPSTREGNLYRFEMTAEDHIQLLDYLLTFKGKVLLCGYSCPEYETRLTGWDRKEVTLASAMSKTEKKAARVEVLWANYTMPTIV